MIRIGNDWDELLSDEFKSDYFRKLESYVREERENGTVYPPAEDVFNAFKYTSFSKTRCVILGQDPYHEPGQAQGLAFSVPGDVKYPPSLMNMLKELEADLGGIWSEKRSAASDPVLKPWAEEGVLLLNTALTVRAHEAGSHRGKGWERFTDKVIEVLASGSKPVAFILWGANAAAKKDIILNAAARNGVRHLIITAPHPSPLSAYRGFFGGRYYSRVNYFLSDNGEKPINWLLHRADT